MVRLLLLTAAIGLGAHCAGSEPLTVSITGAPHTRGQLVISLFDHPGIWLIAPIETRQVPVAATGPTSAHFDVPAGQYGLAVFHDANADGRLNTGMLSRPVEAVGFSNAASALFGPPDFAKSRFTVTPGGARIDIALTKP